MLLFFLKTQTLSISLIRLCNKFKQNILTSKIVNKICSLEIKQLNRQNPVQASSKLFEHSNICLNCQNAAKMKLSITHLGIYQIC